MPKYLHNPDEYGVVTSHTGYLSENIAQHKGLNTIYNNQQLPCWEDGTPLTEAEIATWEQQKEDARLAALKANYGAVITDLENTLAHFGITLPTTLDECVPIMLDAVITDATLSGYSQKAQVLYNKLISDYGLTDADIYAVSQLP